MLIKHATKHELQAFLRLSGFYEGAISGILIEPSEFAQRFHASMEMKTCQVTYLALIEGVEFEQDILNCGGFKIRKFLRAELDELLGSPRRRLFGDRYLIDADTLDQYWFVHVTGTERLLRWAEGPLFDLKVEMPYSDFPKAVEEALRQLALFNWRTAPGPDIVTPASSSFGPSFPKIPFVLSVSDSLIRWPEPSPNLDNLETEPDWHPEADDEFGSRPAVWLKCTEEETAHLEAAMQNAAQLLSNAFRLTGDTVFAGVAMGFLLKACMARGLEQLLWNIAAIEGALGEEPVMQTLRRRLTRIYGDKAWKTFNRLYKFRSDLVHANSSLQDEDKYVGHLRQARDFARGVVCWVLNYLSCLSNLIPADSPRRLSRKEILNLMDLDLAFIPTVPLSTVLQGLPPDFPAVDTWLMR